MSMIDNEDGRAPSGQALVNDAPAGHRPSGFDPSRFAAELRKMATPKKGAEDNLVAPIFEGLLTLVAKAVERATILDGASRDRDVSEAENAKRLSGEAVAARAGTASPEHGITSLTKGE